MAGGVGGGYNTIRYHFIVITSVRDEHFLCLLSAVPVCVCVEGVLVCVCVCVPVCVWRGGSAFKFYRFPGSVQYMCVGCVSQLRIITCRI